MGTSVYSHFTCENITKDTGVKEFKSIDIHGIRNLAVLVTEFRNNKRPVLDTFDYFQTGS
jgi:hypothetical protein